MENVADMFEKAVEMTGDEALAKEVLKAIPVGDTKMWVDERMRKKYVSMCMDVVKKGKDVTVAELAEGIFLIYDGVDKMHTVCVVGTDGQIWFYSKISECANLKECIDMLKEDDE